MEPIEGLILMPPEIETTIGGRVRGAPWSDRDIFWSTAALATNNIGSGRICRYRQRKLLRQGHARSVQAYRTSCSPSGSHGRGFARTL